MLRLGPLDILLLIKRSLGAHMHGFATIEIPKWNAVTTRSVLVFVSHDSEASDDSTGATHPTTMWKRFSKGLGSMPVSALEKPKRSDSHPFSWTLVLIGLFLSSVTDATRPEDDEAVTNDSLTQPVGTCFYDYHCGKLTKVVDSCQV